MRLVFFFLVYRWGIVFGGGLVFLGGFLCGFWFVEVILVFMWDCVEFLGCVEVLFLLVREFELGSVFFWGSGYFFFVLTS